MLVTLFDTKTHQFSTKVTVETDKPICLFCQQSLLYQRYFFIDSYCVTMDDQRLLVLQLWVIIGVICQVTAFFG